MGFIYNWIQRRYISRIPLGSEWRRKPEFDDDTKCIVYDIKDNMIYVKTTNRKHDYTWIYEPKIFLYMYEKIEIVNT